MTSNKVEQASHPADQVCHVQAAIYCRVQSDARNIYGHMISIIAAIPSAPVEFEDIQNCKLVFNRHLHIHHNLITNLHTALAPWVPLHQSGTDVTSCLGWCVRLLLLYHICMMPHEDSDCLSLGTGASPSHWPPELPDPSLAFQPCCTIHPPLHQCIVGFNIRFSDVCQSEKHA